MSLDATVDPNKKMNSKLHIALFLPPIILLLLYLTIGEGLGANLIVANWLIVGLLVFAHMKISAKQRPLLEVDKVILAFLFIQIVIACFSNYTPNSLAFLYSTLTVVLFYFLSRFWALVKFIQIAFFIQALSLLFGILGLFTLFSFLFFRFNVEYEGFSDIINFKNLYFPLGKLSNVWTSYLLLFLPFTLIAFIHAKAMLFKWLNSISAVFILFSIVVSFSRGAYLSLMTFVLVFTVLFLLWQISPIKKGLIIVKIIVVIAVAGICFSAPVLDTLQFNKTNSQVRSISGRSVLLKGAWDMFKANPVSGVGQNSATLHFNQYLEKSEDTFFTNRVSNSLLQLLSEQGILGFISYLTIVGFLLFYLWKSGINKKEKTEWRITSLVFLSTFSALLVREMTFSSFFEEPKLQIIFAIILAITVNSSLLTNHKKTNHTANKGVGAILFLLVLLITSYYYSKQIMGRKYNKQFVQYYQSENYRSALNVMNKAVKQCPNQALFYAHRALVLTKDSSTNLFRAVTDMESAVRLSPSDAMFHHNLGILYARTNDVEKALEQIKKAIELEPYDALYHISYGNLAPQESAKYYTNAIRYSPDILDSKCCADWGNQPEFDIVESKLNIFAHSPNTYNPIIEARKAKILLHLGDTSQAKQLLQQVSGQLPNLNKPWYYLGVIALSEGDTLTFRKYLSRSLLLDGLDYQLNIEFADFYFYQKEFNDASIYYRNGLKNHVNTYSQHCIKTGGYYGLNTLNNDVLLHKSLSYFKPKIESTDIINNLSISYAELGKDKETEICTLYLFGNISLNEMLKQLSINFK